MLINKTYRPLIITKPTPKSTRLIRCTLFIQDFEEKRKTLFNPDLGKTKKSRQEFLPALDREN